MSRETRTARARVRRSSLSDWAFNAIKHQEVLTAASRYFPVAEASGAADVMNWPASNLWGKKEEWGENFAAAHA